VTIRQRCKADTLFERGKAVAKMEPDVHPYSRKEWRVQ
jgi:hypothetical protein